MREIEANGGLTRILKLGVSGAPPMRLSLPMIVSHSLKHLSAASRIIIELAAAHIVAPQNLKGFTRGATYPGPMSFINSNDLTR